MSGKPKLHYFNGRGRMESIRWLLAAAGVELVAKELQRSSDAVAEIYLSYSLPALPLASTDSRSSMVIICSAGRGLCLSVISALANVLPAQKFETQFEECFLETKDDLIKLQKGGSLLFQQVPMVEIDGMKMVQTRAILNYIAAKYNLYGKDLKERALIDMYVEAIADLNELLMTHLLQPADKKEEHFATVVDKATNRYFPVYEKVLKDHGQDFLVGNQFSRADVQLLETLLMAEEHQPDILAKFPLLKSFKARISNIPTIKKFLQPGSQRKPPLQEEDIPKLMKIFH